MYNVFKDDKEGFVNAIRSALDNPIDRYAHNIYVTLDVLEIVSFIDELSQLYPGTHADEGTRAAIRKDFEEGLSWYG